MHPALRSADVVNDPYTRPVARLGYAVDDLQAFIAAGERRVAELSEAISAAEARRDVARQRLAEAATLRRRIAEEWLDAWQSGQADIAPTAEVGG